MGTADKDIRSEEAEQNEHQAESYPFYCERCDTQVALRELVVDEAVTVALGCDHEIIKFAEFEGSLMPEEWTTNRRKQVSS